MTTVAVIGKGKTGGEVLKLLAPGEVPLIFDQRHPVVIDRLKQADVAIIFVPGTAVPAIFDTVLATGIPAVWGSTGFVWPPDLAARLKAAWVISSNFSPMMVLIQKMLEIIGSTAPQLLEHPQYQLHETHHLHKKDQPSGTALSWQQWLNLPCEISSTREGDVKGIHELTISTPTETVSLRHEAHERRVFAEGALKAARYLCSEPLAPGLYQFYDLFKEKE